MFHYLANLKCLSSTCYHWVDTERNSRIYPTATVAFKFTRFESNWLQSVRNIAREDETSWITSSLWQPSVSGVIDSSRSVMHVLYTFLQYFLHTLLSTGFKSCDFGDHSWGGINSGVSLSNNAIVARARWTFQVSQGSVETLFRWGGKLLHHFIANLFTKPRIKSVSYTHLTLPTIYSV